MRPPLEKQIAQTAALQFARSVVIKTRRVRRIRRIADPGQIGFCFNRLANLDLAALGRAA
jgi:hypothetical protein